MKRPTSLLALLWLLNGAQAVGAEWYWRPNDGSAAGTGRSYASAWRKSSDINWAAMADGDTLYVCGRHEYGYLDRELQVGHDNVTIDFECPRDPGSILYVGIRFPDNFAWRGPDAAGNYTTEYGGMPVIATDGAGNRLTDLGRRPTTRDPCPAYGYHRGALYYRPCGPPLTFYPGGGSPVVAIVERRNVRVVAPDLSNGARLIQITNSSGITIERAHLHWAAGVGVIASGSSSDITIVDGEFDSTGQGVVAVARGAGPNARHQRWQVAGNTFRDMNDPDDGHCIGFQSLSDSVIERNECERAGSGIVLYRWKDDVIQRVTVRNNVISDLYAPTNSWGGYGIALTGDACLTDNGSVDNAIQGNRISRASTEGIYIKVRRPLDNQQVAVEVINNQISDSPGGIRWRLVTANGKDSVTPNFVTRGNRFSRVGRQYVRPDYLPSIGSCP